MTMLGFSSSFNMLGRKEISARIISESLGTEFALKARFSIEIKAC